MHAPKAAFEAASSEERGDPVRTLDLAFASVGALLYAPFFAGVAFAIFVDDQGPIFFRQTRLGKQRRPFSILKIRTMAHGEVTRVGRWLRPTGLDETAQFLNVLSGQMRMVGPRPLTPADVERLGWGDAIYDVRFAAPPGITGLAQLFASGPRHALALDRLYLRRQGVALDLYLIALSFLANLVGKRRVRPSHGAARRWWARARRRTFRHV